MNRCCRMNTLFSLVVLAVLVALHPPFASAQKSPSPRGVVRHNAGRQSVAQTMRNCGEEAPVVPHPFGSLRFNGKAIQLNSVMQHQRHNVRYIIFEVSVSDTTLPLGPAAAPGMLLGIAIQANQKPGILKLDYVLQAGNPNLLGDGQTSGAFLQAHGYLTNAGTGSVLEVNLSTNNNSRLEGTFTLRGVANPKLNFPACRLEGTFHSPAPMKMSWDVP
jgi:hypothetical protein